MCVCIYTHIVRVCMYVRMYTPFMQDLLQGVLSDRVPLDGVYILESPCSNLGSIPPLPV